MENKDTKPLATIKQGQTVKIVQIDAGYGLNNRLRSMGLLKGVDLTVVSNQGRGAFVVKVKESRVVLGRGIASKIMVS